MRKHFSDRQAKRRPSAIAVFFDREQSCVPLRVGNPDDDADRTLNLSAQNHPGSLVTNRNLRRSDCRR